MATLLSHPPQVRKCFTLVIVAFCAILRSETLQAALRLFCFPSLTGTGLRTLPCLFVPLPEGFCHSPLHFRCYSSPHSLHKGTVHLHCVLSLDILKTGDLHNLIRFKCIPLNHICPGLLHSFAHQAHRFGLHFLARASK